MGVTRSRLAGARAASGDVLVFLDAQCEVVVDWLRPLLHRIKGAPHAVLTPLIDMIEAKDLKYDGGNIDFEVRLVVVVCLCRSSMLQSLSPIPFTDSNINIFSFYQ